MRIFCCRRDSFEAREVCNRTREGTRNDASTPSNKSKIYILHALDYVEALKLGSVQEKEWVAIFEDDILLTVPAARARQVPYTFLHPYLSSSSPT